MDPSATALSWTMSMRRRWRIWVLPMVPAALAVRNGTDLRMNFLLAVVTGYEVMGRCGGRYRLRSSIADFIQPRRRDAGIRGGDGKTIGA